MPILSEINGSRFDAKENGRTWPKKLAGAAQKGQRETLPQAKTQMNHSHNQWLCDLLAARMADCCLQFREAVRRKPFDGEERRSRGVEKSGGGPSGPVATGAVKSWIWKVPVKLATTKRFEIE